jgi:sulfur-carrier protein
VAIVWIPALWQDLTGGVAQARVEGASLRQIVQALEASYPGLGGRLCTPAGTIKPEIAVAVDGGVVVEGLRACVAPDSEVHFILAISGG